MSSNQAKIGKQEMEKLRKSEGNVQEKEKKKVGPIIVRVIGILISLAYYVILLFGKYFMDPKGVFYTSLNVFSGAEKPNHWIRIASLAILTLSISFVLRFLIGRMAKNKGITQKTGVAIIELFGNFVKYAAFIVLIFLILNAVGVDTTALLASLGILSLILGLGMTSLIEDIVAGVFIIAERTFDVGDIIVLDGFRGTVVSVGIRSTKIADIGGDILTVRNSSIGSTVNLTDRTSCAALTFPIAPTESLEHVEAVIKEHFHAEEIKEKYEFMAGVPMYLGLCEITKKGVQMLLFIAGCKEEFRYDTERALYHEVKTVFDSNNVQLGYTGIEEEEDA